MKGILKYGKACFLLALILWAASCTEIVDVELESTYSRLVVQAAVTTDPVKHRVLLTSTSDYYENKPASTVSGASVELSFDEETILLIELDSIPGLYETPYAFMGVPGTTYELDISQIDVDQDGHLEDYHASSTMPSGTLLHAIELKYFSTPVVSGYQVLMYANHPPEQRDWFGFKLMRNRDLLTDTLIKYNVFSDDLFDDGYLPGLPVGLLDDDDPRQAVQPGDTIIFELDCIDQSFYEFVTDAQLEIIGNNPLFSGPPANIKSNISNGAMGIFAAYSVQRAYTIMPQKK